MRFSVIVPVYNVLPYLQECLESLLAQTYGDWEAICVDDGSTDGSGGLLDDYAARDGRIRVVHQANAGEGGARNAGIGQTLGEWLCFLDSDDVLNPRALELYARGIAANGQADLVILGCDKFSETEVPVWTDGKDLVWRRFDVTTHIPEELMDMMFPQAVYRKSRFGKLRFPGLCIGADGVYFTKVLASAQLVVWGDVSVYGYRQRATSALHAAPTLRKCVDKIRYYSEVMKLVRESPKMYPASFWRKMGLDLTQFLADDYACLEKADRGEMWKEWLPTLAAYGALPWTRGYERLSARVISAVRSRFLMWLFGYGVHWLKRHGVNRRLAVHVKKELA